MLALSRTLIGTSPEQILDDLYAELRSQLELVACIDHIVVVAGAQLLRAGQRVRVSDPG